MRALGQRVLGIVPYQSQGRPVLNELWRWHRPPNRTATDPVPEDADGPLIIDQCCGRDGVVYIPVPCFD